MSHPLIFLPPAPYSMCAALPLMKHHISLFDGVIVHVYRLRDHGMAPWSKAYVFFMVGDGDEAER
jgi:hypothetical protein